MGRIASRPVLPDVHLHQITLIDGDAISWMDLVHMDVRKEGYLIGGLAMAVPNVSVIMFFFK